ncbi:MAG TPA: sensor histidine kinase [Kofleriaceae bacterium]|nr:sensor histidine kinase [Kofleriaceae bacterium]
MWPYFNPIYLLFLFLVLLFLPRVTLLATCPPSALAVLLFMPIYALGCRAQGAWRLVVCAATAALGFALFILFNPGGYILVIYAMVQAAYFLRPRAALLVMAGLVALLAGLLVWTGEPWSYLFVTAVIGPMAALGIYIGRVAVRRNSQLRLTQEEVERLARMTERERIGRDLHDLLGHTLSLIALKSELAGKLLERDPGSALGEIREVEGVARDALGQVRRAVTGIRAAGLEVEVTRARLALLSREVELDARLDRLDLAPEVETALAMALREAVTNVLRHARAGRVEVALRRSGSRALMEIADNGRGGRVCPGQGLMGMKERVNALGGAIEIDSAPGSGTRLRLSVPLSLEPARAAP